MEHEKETKRVVTVMRNCSEQLRKAYNSLSELNVPPEPLMKIDGVAQALHVLSEQVEAVLLQSHRTIGGLEHQVHRLHRENRELELRFDDGTSATGQHADS